MSEKEPTQWEAQQPLLQDSEALFNLVKKFTGVMTGFAVIAVSISFGLYYARQEDVIRVLVAATLGWSGYLFAHYMATGKFIHQQQDQRILPNDLRSIVGGIYGILMITAGIAIWAVSFRQQAFITMILGLFLALLGYLIAHYKFTGDIL
jgi:hypothetical protein